MARRRPRRLRPRRARHRVRRPVPARPATERSRHRRRLRHRVPGEFHAPDPNGAPVLAVDIPEGSTAHRSRRCRCPPADQNRHLLRPTSPVCCSLSARARRRDRSRRHRPTDAELRPPRRSRRRRRLASVPHRGFPQAAHRHVDRGRERHHAGAASPRRLRRPAYGIGHMVRHSAPGVGHDPMLPTEVVTKLLPQTGWAREVLDDLDRFHSVVIGPGLGRADTTAASVRDVVTRCPLPMVVDADGLFALAWSSEGAASVLRARTAQTVLTPHDGEYSLLMGSRVGSDRVVAARRLADQTRSVVLLKGAATVVAAPNGGVLVVDTGDERLATAGTGDVLSGIVGSLLAQGMDAWPAAAAGAWIHGMAARRGPERGLVASDLPPLIPAVLADLDLLAD
ncbi:MAG: NAD(P)H-hydrate dehydratase [Ilumatobacteraceae bacterium]